MNNLLPSESSSGCESGWTLYLDPSFLSPRPSHGHDFVNYRGKNRVPKDEDEEEDMSMVSDASSGPQIFHENEYYDNAAIDATLLKNSGKKNKNRGSRSKVEEEKEDPSFLDDTASSPFLNFSQSQQQPSFNGGYYGLFTGGSSEFHEPFGFFQSSLSGNRLYQNQKFGGKMGM